MALGECRQRTPHQGFGAIIPTDNMR